MGSVWLSIFLVIRDLPTPDPVTPPPTRGAWLKASEFDPLLPARHSAPDPWRMAEGVGVRPTLLPARHSAPDPWRMAEDGCPSPCQPCR